jgi:AraC family transcriptional regulator, L-rhamnose operon regulatory protein RhaS
MDVALPARPRPAVFRQPGSLLYADNCKALQAAAARQECRLVAWTRGGYPGKPLEGRLPGLCTAGFWDAPTHQNWGLKLHCNEGVKMACVTRGTLRLEVDGVPHELTAGQMFIIRPWQLHAIGSPNVGPNQLAWVMIDLDARRPDEAWQWPDWLLWSAAERQRLTEYLTLNNWSVFSASDPLADGFRKLCELLSNSSPETGETRLKLLVNALLLALLEVMDAKPPPRSPECVSKRRTVEVFLERLRYALDRDWTLDDMAAECRLSRTRFAHYCRMITNQTPKRFLQHLRLQHAHRLIRAQPDRTLTDIAMEAGIGSSQYFSTLYKRRFGVSPSSCISSVRQGE